MRLLRVLPRSKVEGMAICPPGVLRLAAMVETTTAIVAMGTQMADMARDMIMDTAKIGHLSLRASQDRAMPLMTDMGLHLAPLALRRARQAHLEAIACQVVAEDTNPALEDTNPALEVAMGMTLGSSQETDLQCPHGKTCHHQILGLPEATACPEVVVVDHLAVIACHQAGRLACLHQWVCQ